MTWLATRRYMGNVHGHNVNIWTADDLQCIQQPVASFRGDDSVTAQGSLYWDAAGGQFRAPPPACPLKPYSGCSTSN
ncbi:hypothetical protein ACLKA7_008740 [Drosophila subpalustris]